MGKQVKSWELTGDLDRLDAGLLDPFLGHGDREHSVLHRGLDLIRLGVRRQGESAQELAAAALDAVPGVGLLLALSGALAADLEDRSVLHLDLDVLLVQAGEIGLEDMSFGGLLPVDAGVSDGREGRVVPEAEAGEGEARVEGEELEGVAGAKGEGIEEAAPPRTEAEGSYRHLVAGSRKEEEPLRHAASDGRLLIGAET